MSRIAREGFTVAQPNPDHGTDVIAVNETNGRAALIQVKVASAGSTTPSGTKFQVTLNKGAYDDMTRAPDYRFYVFYLGETLTSVVVMSASELAQIVRSYDANRSTPTARTGKALGLPFYRFQRRSRPSTTLLSAKVGKHHQKWNTIFAYLR